jgi:GntR family transcriptional regulator
MKPAPDSPAFQPLYRQIKELITQSLVSGEWGPGDPIPSELELASRFNVSQGTVRKAVSELAEEKLLVRQQGRGTFVASHAQERSQFPFLRLTPDTGERGELSGLLLDLRRMRGDSASLRLLGLAPGSSIYVLRRILRLSDKPVCYEEIRLPSGRFHGLSSQVVEQHECMLYSMYEGRFGLRVLRAEERIKAVAASDEAAAALGTPRGMPMLLIERVAFTYGAEACELRRSYNDTRHHHYWNQIIS